MDESVFSLELTQDKTERIDFLFNSPFLKKSIKDIKNKLSKKGISISPLKSVASVNGGKRLPKGTVIIPSEITTIPYISATDIKDGQIDFENCKKLTPELYSIIKNYNLKKEDLVITIVGTIGEVGIVNSELQENAFNENVARIRKKEENQDDINTKFLAYMLNTSFCKMQTTRLAVGSLQYKLSLKNCREVEIALPEIETRIDIDKQNEILKGIEKIEQEANDKIKQAKNIASDVLLQIQKTLGLKDIPEKSEFNIYSSDLELDRIDALFNSPFRTKIINIVKQKNHDTLNNLIEIQEKGEILPTAFYNLVELDDIDELFGDVKNIKEVPSLESDKVVFRKGEILVSKLEPEKGKIIMPNDKTDGCVGSSELIPLKVISEKVLPEYLWIIMRTPYVLRQWEYSIRGCSRERIGEPELFETLIPLTDRTTQQKIIDLVLEKYKEAQKLLDESKKLKAQVKDTFLNKLIQ